jgi:hypothetical protein
LLLAVISPEAIAQQITGTLSGTVHDASGAIVPGAQVVLKNEASGDVRTVAADSAGRFVITAIQPANYSINIQAKGFAPWQENDVVMNQGDSRDIPNIKLEVGSVASQVEVVGSGVVVPTDTAEISTSLNQQMIDNFPLEGRDAGELMKIMPGMALNNTYKQGSSFNDVSIGSNSGPVGAYSSNGAMPYGTMAYMLDGANLVDPGNFGTQIANINADMIGSIKFLTSNYGAEYAKGPTIFHDYYLERRYPSFGNLVPRDVASRNAKAVCDEGRGVGLTGLGVYLDFTDAIRRLGVHTIRDRYDNLFEMYQRITDEDPYKVPMRIYPAIHYTMGGLWVDYNLQSTIPGLFVVGEANFSDHGANRLGASALMQGLSDGYFIVPYTVGNYLATNKFPAVLDTAPEVKQAVACVKQTIELLLSIKGKRTVDSFHRELGKIVWDYCGMSRTAEGLESAIVQIRALQEEYWKNVNVPGSGEDLNQSLEKAGRVADFFELAELMCIDALDRNESCGGHFREEYQTPEGEAQRDDEHYSYVAAWDYRGPGNPPTLIKEPLEFHYVHPSQRSYK